ncbi:hypothetical protein PVNG_02491 [Plasmodium vivax North Korean]|uniref:L-lactate dehydrogenase n=1 Tax=Plasmodium vivax North Korean TaxID=1035514 RepID=A0A0J9TNQ4_PLAVI|nr:hypothetical protein PVNG_02491 [Plasmodium vivax North Korean]
MTFFKDYCLWFSSIFCFKNDLEKKYEQKRKELEELKKQYQEKNTKFDNLIREAQDKVVKATKSFLSLLSSGIKLGSKATEVAFNRLESEVKYQKQFFDNHKNFVNLKGEIQNITKATASIGLTLLTGPARRAAGPLRIVVKRELNKQVEEAKKKYEDKVEELDKQIEQAKEKVKRGEELIQCLINKDLAVKYGLLDYNNQLAEGQVLDLEDSTPYFKSSPKLKVIKEYSELREYSHIVITAGRVQKEGETRLQMIEDNAKIMKSIAEGVKSSGFSGIVLICSNPVDVLTYVFQKVTGFKSHRVIGSGTVLDSSRLKVEVSKALQIPSSSIEGAFVIGEHGDSSLVTFSLMRIAGLSLNSCEEVSFPRSPFCCSDYEVKLEKVVYRKAYEIITRKRATHFGIGAALVKILQSIIHNTHEVLPVSVLLEGQYGLSDVVMGAPAILCQEGIKSIVELPLKPREKEKFVASAEVLRKNIEAIRGLI